MRPIGLAPSEDERNGLRVGEVWTGPLRFAVVRTRLELRWRVPQEGRDGVRQAGRGSDRQLSLALWRTVHRRTRLHTDADERFARRRGSRKTPRGNSTPRHQRTPSAPGLNGLHTTTYGSQE